jgi:hypothetical protein
MARWSDRGRSNLIYTGSSKLKRLIRHLPAYSIRDRGDGLDHKSGSMAAIFICSISPIEGLAKQGRPSMCKDRINGGRWTGAKAPSQPAWALWQWKQRIDKKRPSGSCQLHYQLCSHNLEESLEVISRHMQTHFHAYPIKRLCQEMRGTHPCLERAEWLPHRLPSQTHFLRHLAETFLHDVNDCCMFPASDAAHRLDQALHMIPRHPREVIAMAIHSEIR